LEGIWTGIEVTGRKCRGHRDRYKEPMAGVEDVKGSVMIEDMKKGIKGHTGTELFVHRTHREKHRKLESYFILLL
jgi:hypothetical protein